MDVALVCFGDHDRIARLMESVSRGSHEYNILVWFLASCNPLCEGKHTPHRSQTVDIFYHFEPLDVTGVTIAISYPGCILAQFSKRTSKIEVAAITLLACISSSFKKICLTMTCPS